MNKGHIHAEQLWQGSKRRITESDLSQEKSYEVIKSNKVLVPEKIVISSQNQK